jgi:hypothetical protein
LTELDPVTEDDMVLAFLRAEIDSPRFGSKYRRCLDQLRPLGVTRSALLDDADLSDPVGNAQRIELLKAVRGFHANAWLFEGFPRDVSWRLVALEPADWVRVKYANYPTWVTLSGGTRLVTDGARNIDSVAAEEDAKKNVKQLATEVAKGTRYPDLIGVYGDEGEIILVEGHSRATAYVIAQLTEPVRFIVGSSRNLKSWAFY